MEHPTHSSTPDGSNAPRGAAAPDVERLAEAVYRLMLADTRLEQSRSGGTGGTKPRG